MKFSILSVSVRHVMSTFWFCLWIVSSTKCWTNANLSDTFQVVKDEEQTQCSMSGNSKYRYALNSSASAFLLLNY